MSQPLRQTLVVGKRMSKPYLPYGIKRYMIGYDIKGMLIKRSKEVEGSIAQSKCPGACDHDFTLFLLLTRLIKTGKLGLFKVYDLFIRVRFVVEL